MYLLHAIHLVGVVFILEMAFTIFRNFAVFLLPILMTQLAASFAMGVNFDDMELNRWNGLPNVDYDADGESWDDEFEDFDLNDDYENDVSLIHRSIYDYRGGDRNAKNAWAYKLCQLKKKLVPFGEPGYEYKPHNLVNLTCEETDISDPFYYTGKDKKDKEFCYMPQSRHGPRKQCTTKYSTIDVFRRKFRSNCWENVKLTMGVGCGCHINIKQ